MHFSDPSHGEPSRMWERLVRIRYPTGAQRSPRRDDLQLSVRRARHFASEALETGRRRFFQPDLRHSADHPHIPGKQSSVVFSDLNCRENSDIDFGIM